MTGQEYHQMRVAIENLEHHARDYEEKSKREDVAKEEQIKYRGITNGIRFAAVEMDRILRIMNSK